MGSDPSWSAGDTNRPVSVSWEDATNYCAQLTQQERVAGRIRMNCVYRLPTEAEWEYACRAWTSTRFSYGDDPDFTSLANYAWYAVSINEGNGPRPVGQKLPNPWGLYDMHGNVWELCHDWWSDSLPGGIALDYPGPANGQNRVIRGGGAGGFHTFDLVGVCRSASRDSIGSDIAHGMIGFRVVLAPSQW